MINSFSLALIQLFDKSLRNIIWISLGGSLIIFLIIWLVIGYTILETDILTTDWLFGVFDSVFQKILGFFGGTLILVITWFLFPSVVTLVVAFLLENVAKAVEKKHYPHLSKPRSQSLSEILLITLKFTILSVIINVLAAPIYISLLFFGPLNLLIFYMLNGYLLGREYFELTIHRRANPSQAKEIYKKFRGKIILAGGVISFFMTIPLVNMIAPIIATAAMVHLIQKASKSFLSINT